MNRRSFLKATAAAAFYDRRERPRTKHIILLVNGGGARKKDYYEDAALAPNVRRIANEAFVFEEDHCDTVSSHDAAFTELVRGINYRYVEAFPLIPRIMREERPAVLVCRELAHDVGHDDYEKYLSVVRRTDERIGIIFDWIKNDKYFNRNTAIVIRPEFGRDDEINQYGQLHHSYGYYYTHRVASLFWGPDISPGVDKTTVINRLDLAPILAQFASFA